MSLANFKCLPVPEIFREMDSSAFFKRKTGAFVVQGMDYYISVGSVIKSED